MEENMCKKTYKLIIYIIVVFVLIYSKSEASLCRDYSFPREGLSITQQTINGAIYDIVRHNECQFLTDDIGGPQLPTKTCNFIIPSDAVLKRVKVISFDSITLSGEYNVFPLQTGEMRDTTFTPSDVSLYDMDYPGLLVRVLGDGYRANFHLVALKLYPVQHCNGRLILFTRIAIELEILPSEFKGVFCSHRSRENNERLEQTVKAILENPEDLSSFKFAVTLADPSSPLHISDVPSINSDCVDFIVITTDELEASFKNYAIQMIKKGIVTTTKTTSWISSNFEGRDLQEKIRNFIKAAYSFWGTTYVLLAGDVEQLPVREIENSGNGLQYTDLYYSDLECTWDENCNNIFGEWRERANLYSIQFFDENHGWMCANRGIIARTFDGGETWNYTDLMCNDCYLYKIRFVSVEEGWCVGKARIQTNGKIYHSMDGGETWNLNYTIPNEASALHSANSIWKCNFE
jgi:hypothetical protein